jgi:hypothetical protein
MIQKIVDWHEKLLGKTRKWKYGEDGKYAHMALGAEAVILFILSMLFVGQTKLSWTGLSVVALISGIVIEVIQKKLLNGKNTKEEYIKDALWVWVGGTIFSYPLLELGLITLYP